VFISAKFAMSVIQILAESSLLLSVLPSLRSHRSVTGRFSSDRPCFCLAGYRRQFRRGRPCRHGSLPCSYAVRSRDVRSSSLILSTSHLSNNGYGVGL